jgi:hypothetical protein
MLQEKTVLIQVPQEEAMQKIVMMIQLQLMVVTRTQRTIQSQPTQQTNCHESPMRSKHIAWTLLKVRSQHFSGGPCRESAH